MVYVGLVTVEVVIAPLPGAMLYAPAGCYFWSLLGRRPFTAWQRYRSGNCLSVVTLGFGSMGNRLLRSQSSSNLGTRDRRARVVLELAIAERGLSWNSRSPSAGCLSTASQPADVVRHRLVCSGIDVHSYLEGDMLGTLLGMAPLCFAQAWLAEELLSAYPKMLYPLLLACGIYAVLIVWVLIR